MKLVSGIAATVRRDTTGLTIEPTEQDVRTVLVAAFPPMMGHYGVTVEHVDGSSWLVTVPAASWEAIESEGYFEYAARLPDGSWAKIEIEYPY